MPAKIRSKRSKTPTKSKSKNTKQPNKKQNKKQPNKKQINCCCKLCLNCCWTCGCGLKIFFVVMVLCILYNVVKREYDKFQTERESLYYLEPGFAFCLKMRHRSCPYSKTNTFDPYLKKYGSNFLCDNVCSHFRDKINFNYDHNGATVTVEEYHQMEEDYLTQKKVERQQREEKSQQNEEKFKRNQALLQIEAAKEEEGDKKKREEDRKLMDRMAALLTAEENTKEEAFKVKENARKKIGREKAQHYEANAKNESNQLYRFLATGEPELYTTAPIFTKDQATLTNVTTVSVRVIGKSGIKIGFQAVNTKTGYTEEYMVQLEQWRNAWQWYNDDSEECVQFTNWFKGDGVLQASIVGGDASDLNIGMQREGTMEFIEMNLDECCERTVYPYSRTCIPLKDRPTSNDGKVLLKWNSNQRTFNFLTNINSGYTKFQEKTAHWKATDRVRFRLRTQSCKKSHGRKPARLVLENAPLGACNCVDNSCMSRENCPKEGDSMTLRFNASQGAKGFSIVSQIDSRRSWPVFKTIQIGRLDEVRIVAEIDDGSEIQDLFVQSEETTFVLHHLKEGASMAFGGQYDSEYCFEAGKVCNSRSSVCCGLECNGVCKKCDEASTELGGYCLCYPEGYYSNGRHVQKNGACVLPPGEDGNSIPSVDAHQPDHIKKPKKLHGSDGDAANEPSDSS